MTYLVKGETGEWEVVIGMEVHAQVIAQSKLFSGSATAFGAEQNTQVSMVDAAMPGMLPVINRECVAQAIRTGLGLNARINKYSVFDRKNYFYPDLPQGYQISQYLRLRRRCRTVPVYAYRFSPSLVCKRQRIVRHLQTLQG